MQGVDPEDELLLLSLLELALSISSSRCSRAAARRTAPSPFGISRVLPVCVCVSKRASSCAGKRKRRDRRRQRKHRDDRTG